MDTWFHSFSVSSDGSCFGGSCDHEIVRLWNAEDLSLIAEIDTGFSESFLRLAIDSANHRLFSGTWSDGLSGHDYRYVDSGGQVCRTSDGELITRLG